MKQLFEYGIDHIGFIVRDVEAAIDHIREHYGLKEVKIMSPYLKTCWTNGKPHPQQCKCAIVTLTEQSCKIELLQPITQGGYHWDYVQEGHSGINHICFKVHDFDAWRAHFKAKGDDIFFEYEDEDEANGYRRCMYAKDSFLNMVYEIKEINRYRDKNGVLEP